MTEEHLHAALRGRLGRRRPPRPGRRQLLRHVLLFKGEGKGKFQPKPEAIKAGDQPLKIAGAHSDPFVIDWDGDGDLDLLSGSSDGGVQWAENRAGKGKPPDLEPFRPLIKPGPQVEYGQILREEDLTGPARRHAVWVDDVNGDGKLDLLVGDSATLISPAKGLSEEEFKKKFADWKKSQQEAVARLNSDADEKKQAEAQQRIPGALPAADRIHEGGQDRLRLAVPAEIASPPGRAA